MNKELTPEQIKEQKVYLEWGLTQKEYEYICDKLLGRLPNYTETGLFSVMWSEHCSYKKSKPVLKLFPNKNERVLQGPGEGAGIVDIGDNQAVVFKAESHNHNFQPFLQKENRLQLSVSLKPFHSYMLFLYRLDALRHLTQKFLLLQLYLNN